MSRKLRLFSAISLASLTSAVAIAQGPMDPAALVGGPPTVAAQPIVRSPEETARRAQVVAQVGDVAITVGEVEDQINAQAPFLRARYSDPAKLREFVDNLIRFELLAREAGTKNYAQNREVVRTTKNNAVQQLIRREVNDRVTAESIPMADVEAYYNAHPEEFNRQEMRRASHIVVATRAEAEALIAEARTADARRFRDLAREKSLDTETKLRGGDLRFFTREPTPGNPDTQVDPVLAAAAFALRESGDVSPPIQLGERWSVLKLTGLRAAENRSLADAQATIRMRLVRERQQSTLEELTTRLRTQLNPEIHAERVDAITLDPLPEGAGGMPGMPGAGLPTGATRPPMPGAPGAPPALGGRPGPRGPAARGAGSAPPAAPASPSGH